MIVADPKPFEQIMGFIREYDKILVVGCGTCVTVCLSGGEAQVQTLASGLRIVFQREGVEKTVLEGNVQRQCDEEFVLPILDRIKQEGIEAVITLACGVGVNYLADRTGNIPVFPGVNTTFYGAAVEPGKWAEMCAGCGDCITHLTGGICPVARCSKRLFNGPCGGSSKGKCEVDTANIDCVWQLIYDRLKALGRLDKMGDIIPMKDWRTAAHGGVRHSIRENLFRLDYKKEA
jgi:ferredoxin